MIFLDIVQLVCLALLTNCQQINSGNGQQDARSNRGNIDWSYPFAPNDTKAGDVYWGQTVKDLYRPLQYPFDSKTLKYIEESNAFTNKYFKLDASRDQVRKTLEFMYNYERTSTTKVINGTTYQLYNSGTFTQSLLTRKVGDGPRETLVDPRNMFEKDTTRIACYGVSTSSKYLAYGVNRKGSDWQTFFVIDLATGKQLKDRINWGRFNDELAWKDDAGFFYQKYQQPPGVSLDQAGLENNRVIYQGVWYHEVGTDESKDVSIQSSDENSRTETRNIHYINNRYLLIISQPLAPQSSGSSSGAQAELIDLSQGSSKARTQRNFALSGNGNNYIKYVKSDEEGIEFITDAGAKYRQLVKVKFNSPEKYDVIVNEINEKMLYKTITSGNKRVNFYYWDGISFITYTEKEGDEPKEIKIPFGNAYSPSFGPYDGSFRFKLDSFLYIYQEYEFNFKTQKLTLKNTKKAPGFDGDQYDQYLTHYKAKDGTNIPILMAHKKGIKPDKSRAGMLYGYGGFDIQLHPGYVPGWAYLVKEKDIVLAYALIRGGGERGEDWWKAAVQKTKPLSYSDFSDAVDFLHNDSKHGFVGEKKQFINGGSNGGLLTAATCNLIPDKLGGCIADVGVMDILRYKDWTGGFYWQPDYGFPEDSKEIFEVQMKFSPYQNVLPMRKGSYGKYYPPYLINTGNYDDRVSPVHSLKLAAAIQNNHRRAPNPTLLYVEHNSGHGPSNVPKRIQSNLNIVTMINLSLENN